MNDSQQLITEENPVNEDLENFVFQSYGKGLDLVAEYEGKLVGVCLNGIIEKGETKLVIKDNNIYLIKLVFAKNVDKFGLLYYELQDRIRKNFLVPLVINSKILYDYWNM